MSSGEPMARGYEWRLDSDTRHTQYARSRLHQLVKVEGRTGKGCDPGTHRYHVNDDHVDMRLKGHT
jgi:hypothetical protein